MKICITSTGKNLQDQVDSRFGRAKYFVVYDTESQAHEIIENSYLEGGGAGIKSSQLMIEKGVKKVISGDLGPNARMALDQASIEFNKADFDKTVEQNIKMYK